jgi:hypothetical protein
MSRATSCARKAVAAPTSSILTRLLAGASAFAFSRNLSTSRCLKLLARQSPRNVTATFDLGDKLIQAKDMHGVVMVQSEFFQEQMRALTDQTKSIGESAMKAATGAFTPKG